ncbi:hypothetical protein TNCT_402071 [Trichonephila clavata]|uniref:Uncharacterized protein n=1 Tax=Trichonephila clavata TaxID=2740835 RepID=A0A8X6G9T2_TRICU|nr:hypothetical protein TNCT_402071 [Trichonephila clavata]
MLFWNEKESKTCDIVEDRSGANAFSSRRSERGVIDRTRNQISISGSVRRQGRKAVNKLSSPSHFPTLVERSRCSAPHVKDGGQNGGENSHILVLFGMSFCRMMRWLVVSAMLVCTVRGDIFSSTAHLQNLLHLERHLVTTLHDYIDKTEAKVNQVKR